MRVKYVKMNLEAVNKIWRELETIENKTVWCEGHRRGKYYKPHKTKINFEEAQQFE